MVRLPDWSMLLSNHLAERAGMPFEWGVNDCMIFVCSTVAKLTGEDHFPKFNDYHDEETGRALLEKSGGVEGIITACLGTGSREILKAKRGDVVTVKMPELTGGIVDDSGQRIALVTPKGLIRVPLSKAWRYWSY